MSTRRRWALDAASDDMSRTPRFTLTGPSLEGVDSILLPDGTLWSHAATLGTYTKGGKFTINRKTIENFIKVFTSGSPQKVPVDYNHGSTSNDPAVRIARAKGEIPKAGDVLGLTGVYSVADMTGDLKTTAEAIATKRGRQLSDPRNFGLWMHWSPTPGALAKLRAREFSELSISFDDDWPNNTTGDGQGPTLIAVALCNDPFLGDMLPIAASISDGSRDPHAGSPADSGPTSHDENPMKTLLVALTALTAKPVNTEEEGVTELTAVGTELRSLREYRSQLGAVLGTDPATAAAKLKELTDSNKTLAGVVAATMTKAIDTQVETTVKQYEKAIGTVALRSMFTKNLRAELEAGVELDKTETLKALKELKPPVALARTSNAHASDVDFADDKDESEQINELAMSLLGSESDLKELSKTNWGAAFERAVLRATTKLSAPDAE